MPLTSWSTTRCQISAYPVSTSAAVAVCATASTRLQPRSTSPRGIRSASAPPSSMNATMGTVHPAITAPSAAGESLMASTAKASAMPDIELPAELTS